MGTRAVWYPEHARFPSTNFPARFQDGQFRFYLAFDASTSESCYFTAKAPDDLDGTQTFVVTYRAASATSGTFQFDVSVESITSADALDTDSASSFDTVNTSSADTVPGTAGHQKQVTLTLSNVDSMAAADDVTFKFARNISDSASGDIHLISAEWRDSA